LPPVEPGEHPHPNVHESEAQMDEHRSGSETGVEPPFLQRLYDRPFVLLVLGLAVMLGVFTFWGLWEILHLPQATLP
jgi:hypothetical protein